MYLRNTTAVDRRVGSSWSGLLCRVWRRWMVLTTCISVYRTTGIRIKVIDSGKTPGPLTATQVRHRPSGPGTAAGPATGHRMELNAAAPFPSHAVCHGRLVIAKIRMRLETLEAVRTLQARPGTPTRSCRPRHCTHKPKEDMHQNSQYHGHSVACHCVLSRDLSHWR